MSYDVLPIKAFGVHLLETNDLDPLYVALHGSGWSDDVKKRWLLAYWCYYHAGVACYMAEQPSTGTYWTAMMVAAANATPAPAGGRWPRAKERRHFRGVACERAVAWLSAQDPVDRINGLLDAGTMAEVAKRVGVWPLFGPWISFKAGDMLERCLSIPISFQEAEVFIFKDPAEAALRLWRQHERLPDDARPKDAATRTRIIHAVVEHLLGVFSSYGAPPSFNRSVGLQEVETILCKWKSHCNGHYPLGNDIREISDGLEPWVKVTGLAEQLLSAMPRENP